MCLKCFCVICSPCFGNIVHNVGSGLDWVGWAGPGECWLGGVGSGGVG